MLLPSRFVIFILIIPISIFLFLAWEKDQEYAMYCIPFILLAAAAFSMAPQIDWWWYNKNPPDLDLPIKKVLQRLFPFYQSLSDIEKTKFCQRTALTIMATEFIVPSQDDDKRIPEDLKALLSAHAVMITWDKEKYIMDTFEKVVVYAKPFPSPHFPKDLHAAESNLEDGVVLFSTERMIQALMEPDKVFNSVSYEYAKIFRMHYHLSAEVLPDDIWDLIEKIGGIGKSTIEEHLGLTNPDPGDILLSYLWLFPEQFQEHAADLWEIMKKKSTQS